MIDPKKLDEIWKFLHEERRPFGQEVGRMLRECGDDQLARMFIGRHIAKAVMEGDSDEVMAWAIVNAFFSAKPLSGEVETELVGMLNKQRLQ